MPRYFFNLKNGDTIHRDEEGQEIESLDLVREQAELHAKDIAAQYIHDRKEIRDQTIIAVGADGKVATVVPIKIVLGMPWEDIDDKR